MKHIILFFCFTFFISLSSSQNNDKKVVFVCTGPASECYHYNPDCKGLHNCSAEVISIPFIVAKEKYRPCSFCAKKKASKITRKTLPPRDPYCEPLPSKQSH